MNNEEITRRFEAIEKRLDLIEGTPMKDVSTKAEKKWYKKGSTIHKILLLVEEDFFDNPKTIAKTINEFQSKDYHLKASDLTLPLRKIVRKGILKKTKTNKDNSLSKKWMYTEK